MRFTTLIVALFALFSCQKTYAEPDCTFDPNAIGLICDFEEYKLLIDDDHHDHRYYWNFPFTHDQIGSVTLLSRSSESYYQHRHAPFSESLDLPLDPPFHLAYSTDDHLYFHALGRKSPDSDSLIITTCTNAPEIPNYPQSSN